MQRLYIALLNGKTKAILGNHAIYEEKTNKFSDVFQYGKDVDNDGIAEIISNICYTVGGGQRAMLYDVEGDDIFSGDLIQFFKTQESDMMMLMNTKLSWRKK